MFLSETAYSCYSTLMGQRTGRAFVTSFVGMVWGWRLARVSHEHLGYGYKGIRALKATGPQRVSSLQRSFFSVAAEHIV